MKSHSFKKFLLLLLFFTFITATNAFCQKYFFKKYTEADGLVQGTVREIYQDSKGRMWFGTVDGLSIYDGSEFINYQQEDGLTVPIVSGFLEISDGVMLVATLGNGIEVFLKKPYQKDSVIYTIKEKEYLIDPRVNQIKRDKYGNIWICTEVGITKWLFENNSFTKVIHETNFDGLGELQVYNVSFGQNEKVYFATGKGLLEYSNNQYRLIDKEINKKHEPVFYVFIDSKNTVWFSTLSKFYFLKENKFHEFNLQGKSLEAAVNAISERNENELIIGSLGKIIVIKDNRIEVIDEKNGYTEKASLSLFLDREDNLWVGSLEGVSRLNRSSFRFINNGSVVLNNPQLIKTDKQIFLGNSNGLFQIRNFNLARSAEFNQIESFRVIDYLKEGHNNWFATNKGVILINSEKKIIYNELNSLPHNFVYSIAKDLTGIIWILTQGGLAYIKNGVLYNFKTKSESGWKFSDLNCQNILSSTSIRKVVVDSQNTKWITTWRDGLVRIRNDSIYRFTEKDGLKDLRIRSLYLDSHNNLWVGTRFNGVYKYDGTTFFNYSTKDGLSSNWIFSISEDYKGNYWFCTSKGICRYDGKNWIIFGAADGIYGGEILNCFSKDSIVWFNSWEQIFYYLPDATDEQKIKPTVFFKQISLLEDKLQTHEENFLPYKFTPSQLLNIKFKSDPVEINYSNNTIIFEFSGTSYVGEKQVYYIYKLDGFDKNWTEKASRNYVTYTHLPPGNYTFSVYSINRFGERSETPATFSFTILSPFWLRWWFLASVILLFILLISSINYLVYKSKIKEALRIEKIRSKISTDLHDEIGTSLSSIAIFTELVKREGKFKDEKMKEKLERIENTARELVDKMSDIVWMINPGNDTFNDALLKMKDYALNILESKNIDIAFDLDEVEKNFVLPMELRRNLLLIFKELITNAAKYSNASLVRIGLKVINDDSHKIVLVVEDDGIGFDLNLTLNGNGINNIRQRTKNIGGTCKIVSAKGQGTKATVEIPIL
uniref:Histidine kinase domain-containing protein n=1 Tax=Ignavibacterium album TaxID=591197 RepID=A0A7V2ZJL8_9BACT